MSESPLMIKSKSFALEVIRACKVLREAKCESALINQFLRSGTSIGANISESQRGQSKLDFYAKIAIALKEANEAYYWIRLLHATDYLSDKEYSSLESDINEIISILVAICNSKEDNKK